MLRSPHHVRPHNLIALNPWRLFEELNQPETPRQVAFPMNVIDAGNEVIVQANLPGFDRDQISVQLERNLLTISANPKPDEDKHSDSTAAADQPKYLLRERHVGQFKRSLNLPMRLNPDATEASLSNGVLTIKLSKAAEATARAIPVTAPQA